MYQNPFHGLEINVIRFMFVFKYDLDKGTTQPNGRPDRGSNLSSHGQ